jgi:lipopolysaccharide export system protein LptA
MIRSLFAGLAAASLAFSISSAYAVAQQPAPAQAAKSSAAAHAKKEKDRSNPLGNIGTNNKEPIKIDADRLDVYDREQRAVFQGNVVAVQGDTTIRCTTMTVFYERQSQGGHKAQPAGQKAPAAQAGSQNDSVKQIDCAGPVTVVSKDQVATSDHASFDRAANRIYLIGNAVLSQCQNVTRGEKIVYDLNTQVANVETAPGGRVRALFVPKDEDKAKQQQPQGCEQPQTASTPAPPQLQPAAAPAAPKPRAAAPQSAATQAAAPKPAQKQRAQTN